MDRQQADHADALAADRSIGFFQLSHLSGLIWPAVIGREIISHFFGSSSHSIELYAFLERGLIFYYYICL